MANQAQNKPGYWPVNPNAKVRHFPVAASQTFAKGDALILSSGKLAIGLAASSVLCGVAAEPCAALAEDTMIGVYWHPSEVFEGVADADSSSLTAGSEVDLVGATGAMKLDADASSTDVFKLLSVHADDAAATANARWLFTINKHAFAQID